MAGFSFAGILFRAHDPQWGFLPTSGDGAKKHGGRFNRKGVPALYLSEKMGTAYLEANAGFGFKFQPVLICAYQVNLHNIFDATGNWLSKKEAGVGQLFQSDDCACAWEYLQAQGQRVPSWDVSDKLISLGYTGIAVKSYATGATEYDINFVLWRWDELSVRAVDDFGRIPKNSNSWQ